MNTLIKNITLYEVYLEAVVEMNIESVETFHKLFETKNFTKTAEIMGITEKMREK